MAEPVALGVQVPDSFKTIGSMLNMAGSVQNLQKGNIELQQNAIKLQERKGIQDLFSNPDNFKGDNGQMDYNRLINEGMKVAPTTFPTMVPQIISAHKAGVEAEKALNELDKGKRDAVGQYVLSLGGDDPATAIKKMDALSKLSPQLKTTTDFFKNFMLVPAAQQGPEAWKNAVMQAGRMVMTPSEQKAAMTPSGPQVTNNAQSGTMNLNPMAGPTGIVPGTLINQQIPLNERQRVETNPITQSPQTITKDAFGNVQGVTQTPTGAGVPRLGLGGPQAAAGSGANVAENWKEVNASASKAGQDIGVLQEIKKYAPGAVSGVVQDRRSFITGLAGLLGMDAAQLEKTNTDLLAKNSNMLALAGGDTNLAKQLAEVANPNVHMTKEAIIKAADQVIGQRQLAIARQKFLLPYVSNPAGYNAALTEFNSAADPRILQLPSMSDKEKIDMKKAMSPQEQKQFGEKIRKMQQLGILQ